MTEQFVPEPLAGIIRQRAWDAFAESARETRADEKRTRAQAAARAEWEERERRYQEWMAQESRDRKQRKQARAVFGVADRKTGLRIRKILARPIEIDPAHQRNVWHEFGPEDAYT